MVNASEEFRRALIENNVCIAKATIKLSDGRTLSITKEHIYDNGVTIYDGTSSTSSFSVGSAIINKLVLRLKNFNDEYSDIDFTDAIITVWIGKELPSGRTEWLKKGVYIADDPSSATSVLTIEALDRMCQFDKVYDGSFHFPSSLSDIVMWCCTKCNVTLLNSNFDNYSYEIERDPFGDNACTYREIISYCAQIAGCYARFNADGRLELKWYESGAFEDLYSGGVFDDSRPYSSGDSVNGGNMNDYSSGDSVNGGGSTTDWEWDNIKHINSVASLTASTSDILISGIKVTATDEASETETLPGEEYLYGGEGYVIDISKNPLVLRGKAEDVATYLGTKICGMRFRKVQASFLGDPTVEAGDPFFISDIKGNNYNCFATNLTYSIGGYERISCDAETPSRRSSQQLSQADKILQDSKNEALKVVSEYEKNTFAFDELLANAMGFYETGILQEDGSKIQYMHDKPLLSESMTIWKKTIDAFAVSTDGGQTWKGMDKDGNAVVNVLTSVGVNADWVNAGTLSGVNIRQLNEATKEVMLEIKQGSIKVYGEAATIGRDLFYAQLKEDNGVREYFINKQGFWRKFTPTDQSEYLYSVQTYKSVAYYKTYSMAPGSTLIIELKDLIGKGDLSPLGTNARVTVWATQRPVISGNAGYHKHYEIDIEYDVPWANQIRLKNRHHDQTLTAYLHYIY